MTIPAHKTAPLGELIAAAFDGAATYSADPHQVSRLAMGAIAHLLRSRTHPERRRAAAVAG